MTETEIRNALINQLASSTSGANAAFISELFVDKFSRRADLVMANGKLAVFEIKSERDTLERLKGQISSYINFFEEVTVVCAPRHQKNVEAIVSKNIGIWLIHPDGNLSVLRKAKKEQTLSIKNWLSFLPVDELKKMLKNEGLSASGNRPLLVEAACLLPIKSVRAYVLTFLKRRDKRIDDLRSKKVEKQAYINENSIKSCSQKLHAYTESLPSSAKAIPRRISH
jgi:hypothetical protein